MKYPYVKRLPKFEYLAPKTIDEAVSLLSQHNGEAMPIAGGTDLLLKMKRREVIPPYLVGLKNISGLDYITFDNTEGLRFGPLARFNLVHPSGVLRNTEKRW